MAPPQDILFGSSQILQLLAALSSAGLGVGANTLFRRHLKRKYVSREEGAGKLIYNSKFGLQYGQTHAPQTRSTGIKWRPWIHYTIGLGVALLCWFGSAVAIALLFSPPDMIPVHFYTMACFTAASMGFLHREEFSKTGDIIKHLLTYIGAAGLLHAAYVFLF